MVSSIKMSQNYCWVYDWVPRKSDDSKIAFDPSDPMLGTRVIQVEIGFIFSLVMR